MRIEDEILRRKRRVGRSVVMIAIVLFESEETPSHCS